MRDRRQGLSDADFSRLKAERDSNLASLVDGFCAEHGWDRSEVQFHASGTQGCYCACPDGPCQHQFHGWREFDDGRGGERVCKNCGLGAMSHDMRFMP